MGVKNCFLFGGVFLNQENCLGDSWALSVKVGDEFVCASLCHRLGKSIVPSAE